MAGRSKPQPVGSLQWIQNERQQASEFVMQEVEEFSFSARNELEWLNEHMADIFSTTRMNFIDVFKTPGKLRGKTPRTARKRDALAPRQPLGDIFAPNVQTTGPSPAKPSIFDKVAPFEIAEDAENCAPPPKPVGRGKSPQRAGVPCTDSGYHGLTEDEMDVDSRIPQTETFSQETVADLEPVEEQPAQKAPEARVDEAAISDDSFVSAKEQGSQVNIAAETPTEEKQDPAMVADEVKTEETVSVPTHEHEPEVLAAQPSPYPDLRSATAALEQVQDDVEMEDVDTPQSEQSSPEKPLNRKSSFAFSALPAREPLGAKKSMGHLDTQRTSIFNKSLNTRTPGPGHDSDESDGEKAVETREQIKTSTQLLQERINMLGKTKEPRPSKSIPSTASAGSLTYPQLPEQESASQDSATLVDSQASKAAQAAVTADDDDDDWIAPSKSVPMAQQDPVKTSVQPSSDAGAAISRPLMHQKSMSTTQVPSPRPNMTAENRHQKAFSVSQAPVIESTTPAGSPASKKMYEGPLSASKNRLWSALKSAKNIFASSATASAAAKLEAHNSLFSPEREFSGASRNESVFTMPGAIYSEKQIPQSPSRPLSAISQSPSRKTRSSTESDRRTKAQLKAANELDKAREKEREKAIKQQEEKSKAEHAAAAARAEKDVKATAAAGSDRPVSSGSDRPASSKSGGMSLGKLRAPGRLMKPGKDAVSSKPAPVSIRVASQSQRLGQGPSSQSSFSKSQHEANTPATKDSTLRIASAQGNRAGSVQPSNARVKALEAAARKKEADEKAALKKAEQKRELERKRAAKVEEEKRAEEERRAAEQQRVLEAKQAAQRKAEKQAAEARRREQERLEQQKLEQQKREQERLEQQRREQERVEQQKREQERLEQQRREMEAMRQEEEARKAKEAYELAEAIRRERAQQAPSHPRGDVGGTLRQLVKSTVPVHHNPSKPAKRQFNPDEEEFSSHPPQRPGMIRGPPSFQQTDAKRRRTSEEPEDAKDRPSVMAPPKRPSNWRKDTLSKFPQHGYSHAPPPASHHGTMFKGTLGGSHQMQHAHAHKPTHPSQLVQISNARIPFGDNNAGPSASQQQASTYDNLQQQHNKFKTPIRPPPGYPKSGGHTKPQTPSYQHTQGDNIELPDIATDSEDEDSEDDRPTGARAPSWVASPALRELLTQQQLVDPESVFGPIAELRMDEVFRNGKPDRLKRFRDRGSSAMWLETGDAVTSAEKRRDMEMRERVAREGGWRYEPGL